MFIFTLMKAYYISILAALLSLCPLCRAETRWMNPFDQGAETHGQGWSELRHSFLRLPSKAEGV